MEQHQSRRPATGTPGQRRRALGREGLAVHEPEQLLDLPRPEAQRLAVQLDQLTGDHQPRGVRAQRSAGAQRDPDVAGSPSQQVGQLVLGGEALQLVDVVQDEQERPVGPRVEGPHELRRRSPGRRGPRRSPRPSLAPGAARSPDPNAPPGLRRTRRPDADSALRPATAAWSCRIRAARSPRRPPVRHPPPGAPAVAAGAVPTGPAGRRSPRRSRALPPLSLAEVEVRSSRRPHPADRVRPTPGPAVSAPSGSVPNSSSARSVKPSRSVSTASGLVPSASSAASLSPSWSVSASRGSSPCSTSKALLRLSASSSPSGSSPFSFAAVATAAGSATRGSVPWSSSSPSCRPSRSVSADAGSNP